MPQRLKEFGYQNIYSPKISYDDNRNVYLKVYNTIFIQVPKTGSTSLRHMLDAFLNSEGIKSLKNFRPCIPNHLLYMDEFKGVHKIGFVRNPFDRLVSLYNGKIKEDKLGFFKTNKLNYSSFEIFLKGVCNIPDFIADRHFKSQYAFLTSPGGQFIINDLVRFESYNEDLSSLFRKHEIPISQIDFVHLNKSSTNHYSEYYTSELIELVRKRYYVDLKLFGYEFGKPLARDKRDIWRLPIKSEDLNIILKYKSQALFKEYYKYKFDPLNNYKILTILKMKIMKRLSKIIVA